MSMDRLLYEPMSLIPATLDAAGIRLSENAFLQHHGPIVESPGTFCLPCTPGELSNTDTLGLIPYSDILWCEPLDDLEDDVRLSENRLRISYLHNKKVDTIEVNIPSFSGDTNVESLAGKIMVGAFPSRTTPPKILVLINPFGGQGKAVQIYETQIKPILKAAHVDITYVETQRLQHAVDIALELDIEKYDIIACCSGDGIPHEIINGFYKRSDKGTAAFNKIAVTQLPCGSGNAFALSCFGTNDAALATLSMLKANKTRIDLMAMTQNNSTKLSFLSQTYGLIVECDIGTEWLRWLGPKRFELGTVYGIFAKSSYPCDIYVKYVTTTNSQIAEHFENHYYKNLDSKPITTDTLELKGPSIFEDVPPDWTRIPDSTTSNLNVFYVGKMPYMSDNIQFFPAALPNDHAMDLVVMNTNTRLLDTIAVMTSADKGTHVDHELVIHSKILGYRLVPRLPKNSKHIISVDGESFPLEPFQVEILPEVLTILLHDGHYVETAFKRK